MRLFIVLFFVLISGCTYDENYQKMKNELQDYKWAVVQDHSDFLIRIAKQDLKIRDLENKVKEISKEEK